MAPRRKVATNTTVGRRPAVEILPPGLSFDYVNKALKKKRNLKLINASFRQCGLRETVILADKLMYTGFTFAARSGMSFCVDDMLIPTEKSGSARQR